MSTVEGGPRVPGAPAGRAGRLVSPALVGRADELDRLVSAVSAPPAVVLLEGEAGIGKTRLVTELADRHGRAGHRVVTGRCRPIRDPFPLGPVLEVVRGLADVVAGGRPSPLAGALRPLLPELAGHLPPLPDPLDDRAAERHRVFRALAEVLRAAGPLTVMLEDLHWTDGQTLEFLRFILADPPDSLAWVLTFRGEDTGPDVRALAARLPPQATALRLALAPLDVRATGELAAAIVAVDRVPEDFAAYLCQRTGGLPFAIEEVMALLRERGVVGPQGVAWSGAADADLSVPAAVRDHIRERVDRLPVTVRPLLEVLAVLQRPATEHQVAAVSGRPVEEVASGLSLAVESGLLVEDGPAVGFRHVLAQQAVYEQIPGPRRRELHGRAAVVVRGLGGPALGQAAHHLRAAGRLDEWARVAEQAADQAVAVGHDDEAARLLADVLGEAVAGRVRLAADATARVALKLGRVASTMLRVADVTGLLEQVLRTDLPRTVRAELRILLGALYDRTDFGRSRSQPLFRDAVTDAAERPDLKLWAMVALQMRVGAAATLAAHRAALSEMVRLLPAVADPEFQIFLMGHVAKMLASVGDPAWRELATAIQWRTGGAPRRPRQVIAYEALAYVNCYVGHHRPAGRLLAAATAGARACENQRLLAFSRAAEVLLAYCEGRWDGLEAVTGPLYDELADYPRVRLRVDLVTGGLALARGEVDVARERLQRVVDTVAEFDGSDVIPAALGALVRLHLADGDTGAALAAVDWCLDSGVGTAVWPAMCRCLPWLVRALVAGGRAGDAAALVDRHADELRGRDAPLAPAALHHARGHLAAGRDDAAAAGHLLAAAAHYAALPARYDAALASEDAAAALAATGRRPEAVAALRTALETYRELGATRDLSRAGRVARQLDVPVPSAHRRGHHRDGTRLTPREREVAALVATGRTNKEIAAVLFVSVETVKKHLQAAMRKLGVSSRAALAHRLAVRQQAAGPAADGAAGSSSPR